MFAQPEKSLICSRICLRGIEDVPVPHSCLYSCMRACITDIWLPLMRGCPSLHGSLHLLHNECQEAYDNTAAAVASAAKAAAKKAKKVRRKAAAAANTATRLPAGVAAGAAAMTGELASAAQQQGGSSSDKVTVEDSSSRFEEVAPGTPGTAACTPPGENAEPAGSSSSTNKSRADAAIPAWWRCALTKVRTPLCLH